VGSIPPSVRFHLDRPRVVSVPIAVGIAILVLSAVPAGRASSPPTSRVSLTSSSVTNSSPVSNFSASIGRLVDLLGVAGSGLLALVWARVGLSWFSHDVTKKVQAKERARDALIGSLVFVAALTGLIWGLAHWVLTGS
jgi:hypothetical protein